MLVAADWCMVAKVFVHVHFAACTLYGIEASHLNQLSNDWTVKTTLIQSRDIFCVKVFAHKDQTENAVYF